MGLLVKHLPSLRLQARRLWATSAAMRANPSALTWLANNCWGKPSSSYFKGSACRAGAGGGGLEAFRLYQLGYDGNWSGGVLGQANSCV